jgi:uncharacterized protein (DUF1015 family)
MVVLRPFKGFLANKTIASKLISPPYDVINTGEARMMAQGNSYSFLHVKKPEIDLPEDTDPYSDIVYQTGRRNLLKFISNGWL